MYLIFRKIATGVKKLEVGISSGIRPLVKIYSFFIRTSKIGPRLAVLKITLFFGYIVLNLFLFFLDFLKKFP